MTSPDGTLRLDVAHDSRTSDGTAGMGHDMDDYFDNTTTATVVEIASGRVVWRRSWSAQYDASSQIEIGERPDELAFAPDGRAVIARFGAREERLELP